MSIFVEYAQPPPVCYQNNDCIFLITQFYVPTDTTRYEEIKFALKQNVDNKSITHIYLLNERMYTHDEVGIVSDKITQVDIQHRMMYSDFFNYSKKLCGYVVLINSDIFLDTSIENVCKTDIHLRKKMFAQLRYEYRGEDDLNTCPIFSVEGKARIDTADTWIFHTSMLPTVRLSLFKFALGIPGCDNKIAYIFKMLGYDVYNAPELIKTYHYHRNRQPYSSSTIPSPWFYVIPTGVPVFLGVVKLSWLNVFHFTNCNLQLKHYIETNKSTPFIIPRVAGIENDVMLVGVLNNADNLNLMKSLRAMKNNAGIQITSFKSLQKYSQLYLKAFEGCNMYAGWEPWGNVRKYIQTSHAYIDETYSTKQPFWARAFDIFHYIHNPWTHALNGKTLLIISPFDLEPINAYGIDLFPNCTFIFVKPPQTQGTQPSREWDVEFNAFCESIKNIVFDVALCSCGGFGNLVCSYIYHTMNKSSIYVGGVLQMYFGVYGNRWLTEHKDVMTLYLNSEWRRPRDHEKPSNHNNIEAACYW